MMKKVIILFTVLMVVVSMGAFAQLTDSASLLLTGTVGDFVAITVAPEPAASSLTLSVAQNTPLLVATVTESSNTPYEVTATSVNSFNFQNTGGTQLPYTLYYDNTVVSTSGDVVSSGASAASVPRPVAVTYGAAPTTADAGSYSDTVTFEISTQ